MSIIAVAPLVSPLVAARGFSYSFVDAGYQYTSGDPENFKLGTLSASFATFDYVALRAGFQRGKVESYPPSPGNDPDFTEFQAGARGHYTLMKKKLDAFATGTWFYNSINNSSSGVSSISDAGGIFDAGVRFQATKKWELDASVEYRTGDYDGTFGVIESIYKLTKKLSISLNTRQSNDIQKYFGGVRLDF
ncbi:MAG TPA: hypothetical protein ENK05_01560 [Gammaproteobacteria bacterium]|nr:hypothetical protein [Gammaproteobacteria bacterium]